MSIASLTSTQARTENRHPSSKPGGTPCASFQARLEQAASVTEVQNLHLCLGEDVVCSGGHAGKNGVLQEYCAHYTEDSTPEDPIVRISGTADSGPFDFLCHINSIDPSNASYAELAALRGHLAKTGACQSGYGPLPDTMDFRDDITRKHNFIAEIQGSLTQPSSIVPTASGILGAKELLALYQPYASGDSSLSSRSAASLDHSGFMKEDLLSALYGAKLDMLERMKLSKEKTEEAEDWERLMNYVDAWIETLREEADIEKSARAYADLKAAEADVPAVRTDLRSLLLDRLSERLDG